MEALPFRDNAFDAVTSAGSLSYGDPELVDAEIKRVLRPGGIFICVDSLNHNLIYRFNRWVHYLRGDRTKSTIVRMPTMTRIQSISRGFKRAEVHFFGAVSYLMPILARIIGQSHAAKVSDVIDRLVDVRRSAFKFVLVARGPQINGRKKAQEAQNKSNKKINVRPGAMCSAVVNKLHRAGKKAQETQKCPQGKQNEKDGKTLYRGRYVEPDRISSEEANTSHKVIYCVATLD